MERTLHSVAHTSATILFLFGEFTSFFMVVSQPFFKITTRSLAAPSPPPPHQAATRMVDKAYEMNQGYRVLMAHQNAFPSCVKSNIKNSMTQESMRLASGSPESSHSAAGVGSEKGLSTGDL